MPTHTHQQTPIARSSDSIHNHYYGLFDLLRAILAFTVFSAHADLLPTEADSLGRYAVEIFFALSGFLVGGILLKNAQKPNFWQMLPTFYFNRCVRIWVPYYLLILSYLGLITLRGQWSEELVTRLVPLFTYTHNWANDVFGLSSTVGPINHAWSLAVEEQFYLFCPIIIGLLKYRALIFGVMLLLAIALPLQYSITYYSAICLGVAAASVHQWLPELKWAQLRWPSLVTGISAMVYLLFNGYTANTTYVAVSAVLIVIGLSRYTPKNNLFYLLGSMSYSFYLFHWVGLYIANPIAKYLAPNLYTPVRALIGLGLALSISYASVKWIEWPLIKRRNGIASYLGGGLKLIAGLALSLTAAGGMWLLFY